MNLGPYYFEVDVPASSYAYVWPIRFRISDYASQGKMRNDGGDIRPVLGGQLLPYFLAFKTNVNNGYDTLYVRVPAGGSGRKVRVYHGDLNLESLSNGYSVFEYFNHFEESSKISELNRAYLNYPYWVGPVGSESITWYNGTYLYATYYYPDPSSQRALYLYTYFQLQHQRHTIHITKAYSTSYSYFKNVIHMAGLYSIPEIGSHITTAVSYYPMWDEVVPPPLYYTYYTSIETISVQNEIRGYESYREVQRKGNEINYYINGLFSAATLRCQCPSTKIIGFALSSWNGTANIYVDYIGIGYLPDYTAPPLSRPSLLTSTVIDFKKVLLQWVNTEQNKTIKIYRSKDDINNFIEIAESPQNTQSYVDEDVELGERYFYYVKYYDPYTGYSEPSNIDGVVVVEVSDTPKMRFEAEAKFGKITSYNISIVRKRIIDAIIKYKKR